MSVKIKTILKKLDDKFNNFVETKIIIKNSDTDYTINFFGWKLKWDGDEAGKQDFICLFFIIFLYGGLIVASIISLLYE